MSRRRVLRRPRPLDWRREGEVPPDGAPGPVDVVVPVYRAAEELSRCLAALRRHTDLAPGAHRLIVVEDGGSDPAVDAQLAALEAAPGVDAVVLRNGERRGFVASVNRGMRHSQRDVVLLNSDTEVTAGWLEKMRRAAYSTPAAATVTPWSNDATICSLPRPLVHNELPAGWGIDDLGHLVEERAAGDPPRLPTGVGMCLFVKRKVLDRLGLFDEEAFGLGYGEENEFCLRASRAGYVHLLDHATFVYHAGHASFGASARALQRGAHRTLSRRGPEFLPTVARFLAEDPLAPARRRVVEALLPEAVRGVAGGVPAAPFPRVVHVVHGWPPWSSAGTELYARWLATLQAPRRRVAVYARLADPDRRLGDASEYLDGGVRVRLVVNNFTQRDPRSRNGLADRILDRDFGRFLDAERPDLVHVHHLAGHAASLLRVAARRGVPILYQAQDWWPACARVNFTHASGERCAGPGVGKCAACMPLTGRPPRALWNRLLHAWRRRRWRRLLRLPAALVMGSRFIADTYRRLGLLAPGMPLHVHPYGVPLAAEPAPQRRPPGSGRPLIFGYVGSVLPHKGVHLAAEAIAGLDPERAVLEIWGRHDFDPAYGERLRALAGGGELRLRGVFAEEEKAAVLARFDALLMPSIGYESFGLVAREAMAVGTPVVYARGSALDDLAGAGTASFAAGDAGDLRRLLTSLVEQPERLAALAGELPAVRSFAEHGEAIETVYAELAASLTGAAG